VLTAIVAVTRAGGRLGIPGLNVTGRPGGITRQAKVIRLSVSIDAS